MLCGDNEEEAPEASVYNALCAIEWRGPAGRHPGLRRERDGPGGALRAPRRATTRRSRRGEEPELCLRLRRDGWRVHRLAAPMTVHDADMHAFSEWWRRAERSGTAWITGYAKHGRGPERYNATPTLRALVWGGALPLSHSWCC